MMKPDRERKEGLLGGLGLLVAAGCLCCRGLKRVDAHLRKKAEKKHGKRA